MIVSRFLMLSTDGYQMAGAAGAAGVFLFLSVLMICIFSFVSIAAWSDARRKEREAYYKAEAVRRVAEASGDGARYLIEMMREEERIQANREYARELKKREGLKIGGLVNIGVGIGLCFFMHGISGARGAYLVGLVPGLVGVALLASAYLFLSDRPKQG